MHPWGRRASASRPGREPRKSCPIAAETASNRCRNGEADDILKTTAANPAIPNPEASRWERPLCAVAEAG